jgi:hypothetical protein
MQQEMSFGGLALTMELSIQTHLECCVQPIITTKIRLQKPPLMKCLQQGLTNSFTLIFRCDAKFC